MNKKGWILVSALLLTLAAAAVMAGPDDDRPLLESGRPGGALAFVQLVEEMGFEAVRSETPPDTSGTFVLLEDLRGMEEAQKVVDWVEGGGRLVLADPESLITRRLGVSVRTIVNPVRAERTLAAGCPSPEAVGVDAIMADVTEVSLHTDNPESVLCFMAGTGAYVAVVRHGSGTAVMTGGPSAFTNRLLLRAHNSAFALRAIGARTVIAFGPPINSAEDPDRYGVWAALPAGAKVFLVQIVVATIVFALVRGRRFGRSIPEDPVSPIPSGELVRASARLYRSARATGFASRLLRQAALRRLSRRYGILEAEVELLRRLAARSGMDEERVTEVLGGSVPHDDEDLIRLASDLDALEEELTNVWR